MATPKRGKSGRFKKDGKPNKRPKKATAKRRASPKRGKTKKRAKARAPRAMPRAGEKGLASRVARLESNVEVLHGVSTATVNVIRKSQGAAPIKRLTGYVSPLGRKTATSTRQLGPGR